jgi:hypothetical protein
LALKTPQVRLNEVARIAVHLEQQTGCPAQLLIAQWAIESKWGEKLVGHANYLGIKRAARHTQICTMTTWEVVNGRSVVQDLEFADYDSLVDSCRDDAWLITNGAPYRVAWEQYQNDRDLQAPIALLIIDDFGMRKLPLTAAEDLLEIIMRRYERASTLLTSNRPVEDWANCWVT